MCIVHSHLLQFLLAVLSVAGGRVPLGLAVTNGAHLPVRPPVVGRDDLDGLAVGAGGGELVVLAGHRELSVLAWVDAPVAHFEVLQCADAGIYAEVDDFVP